MRNKGFTRQEEEILREMLDVHISLICRALPTDEELENEPISDSLRKKTQRTVDRSKLFYYKLINTGFKRAACFIVTFLTLASVVTFNAKAVKETVVGFIMTVYEEFTSIFFDTNEASLPYIETFYEPGYITEGFVEVRRDQDSLSLEIAYNAPDGKVLYYTQGVKKGTGLGINTEDGYSEKLILSGGREALYYTSGVSNGIMLTTKDYFFSFSGEVSKEELIKLIESLEIE